MKTLSSLAEYDDVLSSNDGGVVVSCLPSKIEDNQRGQANIFDCRSQGDNENKQKPENLIICDSNLASSLHNVKSDKRITSGHYLQKLLFNYSGTQTVRSQSLPNCVEDEKHLNNSPEENCNSNFLKIHSSHDSTENGENSLNCIPNESSQTELNGCNNETWFKTWPERGSDKRQTLYNENSNKNVNLSAVVENNNEEICVQNTQNQELPKPNIIPAATVSVSPGSNNVLIGNNSPVHLNLALESIPSLGYSPVTKQLHVIQPVTASKIESHNKSVRPKDIAVICSNGNNVIGCGRNESTNDLKSVNIGSDTTSTTPSTCVTKTVNNTSSTNPSLSRVPTETSCCSYSSTVSSLSSDVSLSGGTNDDSALGGSLIGLDHGDSCSLASIGECSILSEDSVAGTGAAASTASCAASGNVKLKKKSLSGFFSRNVFGWKSSSGGSVDDAVPGGADMPSQQRHQHWLGSSGNNSSISSGWKLFSSNKINNISLITTSSYSGHSGYESGSATPGSPCSVRSSSSGGGGGKIRSGHDNVIASSTTALIQLDRPSCLPAKTQEELEKHRQEYQDIVDAARKKELKEAKHRKRQLQIQLRIEEQQAQAARVWNQEILPKWDTMCNSRKTQELWWLGVPPCVRGKVWRLAITNELNLTQQLFDICCLRAHDMLNTADICNTECESTDNKEASVQLIQLDISRTFPNLCIFQQGGPYYDMLHRLLAAYVCYRPDVGYVQGMSFIAAVLILNMDVSDAFTCFANLLNRPLHMAFFSLNQSLMQAYYATYNDLFSENLPRVYKHFVNSNLTADLYLLDWIYTVFTKAMNLDLASRVWDVFLRDGESFLFRAALGILHLCQDSLLKMDFIHGSQYLTRLPDDLPSDQLFKSIATIKMNVGKQTFEQILAFHLQQQQDSVNNH